MPEPPMPDEPCPSGYHYAIFEIETFPFEEWRCVPDAPSPTDPTPEPPSQPEDSADWPFPWNLAQPVIESSFDWLGKIIAYVVAQFQEHFDKTMADIGLDLTDLGDWLQERISETQTNINAFFQEKIEELGEGVQNVQKALEEKFAEISKTIQKKIEEVQTTAQEAIEERVNATETVINTSVKSVQKDLGAVLDPETGIAASIVKTVPQAIVSFIGTATAPFLKQLNATLEAT